MKTMKHLVILSKLPWKCDLCVPLFRRQFLHRPKFCTSSKRHVGYKLKDNIDDCYSLLNVPADCTQIELKDAYLRLAKQYHPDSGTSTADVRKFSQVRDAYESIKKRREAEGNDTADQMDIDEEEKFYFKHTAPQHRQYLANEGIGIGTPSQRQRQYQGYKVRRVSDNVFEYRMKKFAEQSESKALVDNKKKARKIKTSNAMDRLVEDLIQESMQKGDFDDLPGKGKPLQYEERNPMVDFTTHNLNKILINNGYIPEWITMEKEIREKLKLARGRLAVKRHFIGSPPFTEEQEDKWRHQAQLFALELKDINIMINEFNLIVPLLNKQKVHYDVQRETDRVLLSYEQYLPETGFSKDSHEPTPLREGYARYPWGVDKSYIDWGEIWQNIKQNFVRAKT